MNNPLRYMDPSGEIFENSSGGSGEYPSGGGTLVYIAFVVVKNWGGDIVNWIGGLFGGGGGDKEKAPVRTEIKRSSGESFGQSLNVRFDTQGLFTSSKPVGGLSSVMKYVNAGMDFSRGTYDGVIAGGVDTIGFVKSLGTQQGWKNLGNGFVNMAQMSSFNTSGMLMRSEMGINITQTIENIPNMSAYDLGYGVGYGTEKALEFALTRNAGSFGLNTAKISNSIGRAAFNSRLIGGKSKMFGRGFLGSFGGKANGFFNRGANKSGRRMGWSHNNKTHYFQYRKGSKYGSDHGRYIFKYKY